MRILCTFFLSFASIFVWPQNQKAIQVFVNPITQKYGNLDKQYIEVAHDNIEVNYLKKPSQEFGINFRLTYPNDWGWSIGASWKNDFYQMSYRSVRFFSGGNYDNGNYMILGAFFQSISLNMIGFSAGFHRDLNEHIRVSFLLHQYFRANVVSNRPTLYEQSVGSGNSQQPYAITEKVKQGDLIHGSTVPELNFSAEIFNNFNIVVGTRLKFWSFEDYLNVDVYGSFETDAYGYDPSKVLHKSSIDSKDLAFYFGFSYDFPVLKSK